jgi:hypothetical protein
MNPIAEVPVLLYGGHYVCVKIAWERGGELDSIYPCGGHCAQQARKRSSPLEALQSFRRHRPVAIDVLPYQMYLFITFIPQAQDFLDNLGRPAATLPTARERHNAIGAELVAALYDRHEGYIRRMPLDRRDIPGIA